MIDEADIGRQVLNLTRAKVEFGVIPKEHWEQPNWINENKAEASRKAMVEKGVVYAGTLFTTSLCHKTDRLTLLDR